MVEGQWDGRRKSTTLMFELLKEIPRHDPLYFLYDVKVLGDDSQDNRFEKLTKVILDGKDLLVGDYPFTHCRIQTASAEDFPEFKDKVNKVVVLTDFEKQTELWSYPYA